MTREEAVLRLEVLKDFSQNNELKNMHEAIDMAIESLERKRGKWVFTDGYRCSQCNYKLQTTGIPMYCPNCGSEMGE